MISECLAPSVARYIRIRLRFGIEQRLGDDRRLAAVADDLDLEGALPDLRRAPSAHSPAPATCRHNGHSRRCHPADDLAVMPDRLVAQHVGVGGIDDHRDAPQLAARPPSRCIAASRPMKSFLARSMKRSSAGFIRPIDRPKLAIPGREVLLEPQRQQRAHAEIDDARSFPAAHDLLIEPALIFRRHPDLVAEIAGIGDAVDHRRHVGDVHRAMIHELECRAGHILVGQPLQHVARLRVRRSTGRRAPCRSDGCCTDPSAGRCLSNQRI